MRPAAIVSFALLATGCHGRTPAATTHHLDTSIAEVGVTHRWPFDPAPHFAPSAPSPIESTAPRDRLLSIVGRFHVASDPSAPSAPHVLKQERAYAAWETPRLLVERWLFGDVRLSVKCRADRVGDDASCGLLLRAKGGDEFVSVRLDAVAHEVVLARHVGSAIEEISRAKVKVATGEWHRLEVSTRAEDVVVHVDGEVALTSSVPGDALGHVGVLTRGDTVAAFDDLEATALAKRDP